MLTGDVAYRGCSRLLRNFAAESGVRMRHDGCGWAEG